MRKYRIDVLSIGKIGRSLLLASVMLLAISQMGTRAWAQNFPNFDKWQRGDFRGFTVTYNNEQDWAVFESLNANLARVFVSLTRPGGSNQFRMPSTTYQTIDRLLQQARNRNFKLVVTFNPLPKAPNQTYWFNTEQQNSIVAILEQFARHYAGDAAFAGFDILNEPYPVTRGHRNVPPGFDGPTAWKNFASRIITAIRRQDPTRIIIYEFPYWAGQYETLRPIPFRGVVYSSHWYSPHDLTHQGIGGRPMGVAYPSTAGSRIGMWNKSVIRQRLAPVRQFQQTYNLPVYFGEFSCNRKAPGRSSDQYNIDVASLFEEYNWSWSFHAFRHVPVWDAELARGIPSDGRSLSTPTMTFFRQKMAANP